MLTHGAIHIGDWFRSKTHDTANLRCVIKSILYKGVNSRTKTRVIIQVMNSSVIDLQSLEINEFQANWEPIPIDEHSS